MTDADHLDVIDPEGPDHYVWDHSTETVAETFETRRAAETWAAEHGPEYEPVDARPLTDVEEGSE